MNNEEYLSAWKQLIWIDNHPRLTTLEQFPGVVLSTEIVESIYTQLERLKDSRVVYFVPGDNDSELPFERFNPNSYIVGSLADVSRKDSPTRMDTHVFVKVNIEEKYLHLPFRGYEFHVGLDVEHNVWDYTPIKTATYDKYALKSCVVKGVYARETNNFNHRFGSNPLHSYYALRSLGMYVYEPNRAYY